MDKNVYEYVAELLKFDVNDEYYVPDTDAALLSMAVKMYNMEQRIIELEEQAEVRRKITQQVVKRTTDLNSRLEALGSVAPEVYNPEKELDE